ncbi:MAG: sucrose synthase [Candidatus Nitronauta litoralis]|uniref:Sucrose synthase n=1 Tax=Candidatus Nitronauta litoralis TaxID=2705533 RepID=A0A7T0BY64_9BACT|nr:MAG: sucrose synthase [Candidatus Nitronauta litoralis]
MIEPVPPICPFDENELPILREFVAFLRHGSNNHLLRNELVLQSESFDRKKTINTTQPDLMETVLRKLQYVQELLLFESHAVFQYREGPERYIIFSLGEGDVSPVLMSGDELLECREKMAGLTPVSPEQKLEIDFSSFCSSVPLVKSDEEIGKGQGVLNKYVADKFNIDCESMQKSFLKFLTSRFLEGRSILLDGNLIKGFNQLGTSLDKALEFLKAVPKEVSLPALQSSLNQYGVLPGFGNCPSKIIENLMRLKRIFDSPSESDLETFLSSLPLVSRVAVISPHGWFGQDKVLGRPDTGGQIVYILDQVKALEAFLTRQLQAAGVDSIPKVFVLTRLIPENDGTTCNERLEKIESTRNSWILRVPFKDENGDTLPNWISRFHIWPYLERFALDGKEELISEFGGQPELVIGNYSDGNLVASLLASKMDVVQCDIAHALEKSKYLFSALYWKDMEADYKFSLQFTADLLAMNQTDVVISSTAQEIAGTDTVMGQYESYFLYTLPELYKVKNGISLRHPKFNVISPGVDETIYFPYHDQGRRLKETTQKLEKHLFEEEGTGIFGTLEAPERKPIFTMARLDKIKNLTGLVDAFGQSGELQETANLVVVTRTIREEGVTDEEEMLELSKMYDLISRHNLQGKIRWMENESRENGAEFYRIIADRGGVFVQPALFEAFGLTVLESMVSGVPTFATQFGGPMETIQNGVNGFWVNPTKSELLSGPILQFFKDCEKDPQNWKRLSEAGIQRVKEGYTWSLYSEKLVKCANLFRFWNFSEHDEKKKQINQYCNLMYHSLFKSRL